VRRQRARTGTHTSAGTKYSVTVARCKQAHVEAQAHCRDCALTGGIHTDTLAIDGPVYIRSELELTMQALVPFVGTGTTSSVTQGPLAQSMATHSHHPPTHPLLLPLCAWRWRWV
jgi:hypothetical protein